MSDETNESHTEDPDAPTILSTSHMHLFLGVLVSVADVALLFLMKTLLYWGVIFSPVALMSVACLLALPVALLHSRWHLDSRSLLHASLTVFRSVLRLECLTLVSPVTMLAAESCASRLSPVMLLMAPIFLLPASVVYPLSASLTPGGYLLLLCLALLNFSCAQLEASRGASSLAMQAALYSALHVTLPSLLAHHRPFHSVFEPDPWRQGAAQFLPQLVMLLHAARAALPLEQGALQGAKAVASSVIPGRFLASFRPWTTGASLLVLGASLLESRGRRQHSSSNGSSEATAAQHWSVAAAPAVLTLLLVVLVCRPSAVTLDLRARRPASTTAEDAAADLGAFDARAFPGDLEALLGVRVVAADPGSWSADRSGCRAPRLWLLVLGHYRSYRWVMHNHLRMLAGSEGRCWMVVFVSPDEVTNMDNPKPFNARPEVAASTSNVTHLLQEAQQHFLGQFAYLVFSRDAASRGSHESLYQAYFQAGWRVARWAANHSGVTIQRRAVVIRSRPDVPFYSAFNLEPLRRLLDTPAGHTLALSQVVSADAFLACSFQALEWSVGRVYGSKLAEANMNGWGSVLNASLQCANGGKSCPLHTYESYKQNVYCRMEHHGFCQASWDDLGESRDLQVSLGWSLPAARFLGDSASRVDLTRGARCTAGRTAPGMVGFSYGGPQWRPWARCAHGTTLAMA